MSLMQRHLPYVLVIAILTLFLVPPVRSAEPLELKKGDHICIVGNTLAERMQHFGWLETLIHARYPKHELVFRNLGYSGDEIDGFRNFNSRLRSMDFGSHDQWLAGSAPCPQPAKLSPRDEGKVRENRFELTNTKADVIFAFYGYNESWAGEAGLAKFKDNTLAFIKHTLAQTYNGKSAPKLVLFSPLAHEYLDDPDLPGKAEVAASNARLKLYSDAMGEIAKANGVAFVDLFATSQKWLATRKAADPLTINGVHLNKLGDQVISGLIAHELVGEHPALGNVAYLKSLNAAVNAKNFYWYNRYRVTDGFSTYGDRAFLKFNELKPGYGNGLSNYSVGQRELDILDVLTSNRDKVVWAAAQGKELKPDDSNLPEYITVITNEVGELPGAKHKFISPAEELEKMTIGKGLKVELFADEAKFPELVNPVQMAFDTKGRLWVAAWESYPHWRPTEPMADKLLILEDTNNDGKADICKTFAGDIHNPTGFEFWGGGVLVAQGPDLLFLKDINGDDKYDVKERLLHGLDTADTHHTANSFTLDPGGALYFQEGTFHHTQVETAWGPPQRVANGAVFRYEPRAQKFDVYVSHGFANPHGHVFDRWGNDIVVDGTGAVPFHGALFSGHIEFPAKHNSPPTVYPQRTRPCPALDILSSRHFPPEMQGNLLVPNVITFHGILRYKLRDQDSSLAAEEQEPLLSSPHRNFRPADVEVAPDGSIYFTDWQNPIIGHMQHNLRDPSRDRTHGRVYRITYEGRELLKPAKIAGEPIEKLLDLLKSPEDRVRYRAKIELSGRDSDEVIAALQKWSAALDKKDPEYEHQRLETLWVHQHHNVVNPALLEQVLSSPDFRARAAAVRVLCYWRDRISNTADLLKKAAADEHPRVRLEAVRTASFIPQAEAVEIPIIAAELPGDKYIDFLRGETMRTLQPYVDQAKAENRRVAFTTPAGARYFLRNLSTEQLLKEPKSREVLFEILYRPGLQDEQRREAIGGLSRMDGKPELRVVMDAVAALDASRSQADSSVVFDLIRQLTGRSAAELTSARAELERLATTARQPVLRQIGYASLMGVDGSVDKSWALASQDVKRLLDLVNATPLVSDAVIRASLYAKIEPLLTKLPEPLASDPKANAKGTVGRYVRIELPRKGTLTLAEVEVMSGDRNLAPQGKASQKNTASGGEAKRGIDGNKNPSYGGGGQTHTEENTDQPWWEVDLGEEAPIDSVVVYNRADGDLGKRLQGYTLRVLDAGRSEVARKEGLAAPAPSATIDLGGGGSAMLVRRAAMNALTQIRGQETKTFHSLARFVKEDTDRATAIKALQRIPRVSWPADEAAPLVAVVAESIRKLPASERTSPAALDALEFADVLTTLLKPDEAKKMRAELAELGVRVVRIGTLFERMSYDQDVVALQAGKPVEFLLDNSDLMPHNFVILQPGALEEIGRLSEASAQQPAFAARQYVPESPKVLAASNLLQPRQSQKLSFAAPTAPGVYPFVCTYPGHWRRMYGALYVVDDLDAYLAGPEAYLSARPLPIKDDLLKERRPRVEWKYEDLASGVEGLGGRNFAAGKQMFEVAACIACHKLEGRGNEFGPDLLKLDVKLKPVDILKEMLDPSVKINEKFQTEVFLLDDGKTVTGLVLSETPQKVRLIENPLAKAEPIEIAKDSIESRKKSPTSIMPKGLLDKLTRDEILDLVAYIAARADKSHVLFTKGHEHGK